MSPRWAATCQTSPNIKVWYHPYYASDAAVARSICELVDCAIWPQLFSFMGRGPLPDDTMPNTGGDARFDIYLADASSEVVYPLDHCKQTPSSGAANWIHSGSRWSCSGSGNGLARSVAERECRWTDVAGQLCLHHSQ